TSQDCNANSVPDECDVSAGTAKDCNANDIPDECDISGGASADTNDNGVPDECETIANIHVWYELTDSTGAGGAAVEVQQGATGAPLIVTVPPDQGSSTLTIRVIADVDAGLGLTGYSTDLFTPAPDGLVVDSFSYLAAFDLNDPQQLNQAAGSIIVDAGQANLASGPLTGTLTLFEFVLIVDGPPAADIEVFSGIGANGWVLADGVAEVAFADSAVLVGSAVGTFSDTPTLIIRAGEGPAGGADCNGNGVSDDQDIADGTSQDCNTNGVPDDCDITQGTSADANGDGIPDECAGVDCNANGTPDNEDIAANSGLDCDGNGVIDKCEIEDGVAPDCNGNGKPDSCDIADGSADVDGNGVPDMCDPDCDGNGVPDGQDIAAGTSQDCNSNGVPDDCDITVGTSQDCNTNGVPDDCDIANGTSADDDTNGVPDECEDAGGGGGGEEPQPQPQPDDHVVNRTELRNTLDILFGPAAGTFGVLSVLWVLALGPIGLRMGLYFFVLELFFTPTRTNLMELTFSILDAILP
ncbi:MAG: hypothetical protein ACE5F9_13290, partial [Phycisphaerae bacterium]